MGSGVPRDYSFSDQLVWSSSLESAAGVADILLEKIPKAIRLEMAKPYDDKNGTDYWVYRSRLPRLSIDLKRRALDPYVEYGVDDLALERWSVIEQGKVGWTIDDRKHTDYIFWYFEPTGRNVLVPFPMLCHVAQQRMDDWMNTYQVATQSTDGGSYHSRCVFVPRRVVWSTIYQEYGGRPDA